LGDDELTFTFVRPDQDVGATKADLGRELSQVKQNLEWLRQDFRAFDAALPAQVRDSIVARRTQSTK
jgi:hypothetical protein